MAKKKKRQRRKDERPSEILEAAMAVFIEQGFGGAKIIDIAKQAKVAKGTVYLYFETKEEIFQAVVRQYIQPTHTDIRQLASKLEGSCSEILALIIHRFYQEFVGNEQRRAIMQILISEGHRFPELTEFYYQEIISKAEKMMKHIIKRGIETGEFQESPAQRIPAVIMGPAVMAAIWKMIFDNASKLNLKKYAEAHVEMVLNSLQAKK